MSKERVTFNLDIEKKRTLQVLAEEQGVTLTTLLTLMINKYLNNLKKEV